MQETNMTEAFASYKTRAGRTARSAMTPHGDIVISCRYEGFKKVQAEILQYEEDLSGQSGESATNFRAHLAVALAEECEIRVIVAIEVLEKKVDAAVARSRMNYYARKDLVGRVVSFDGERFVVAFRKNEVPVQKKRSKVVPVRARPATAVANTR